MRQYVCQPARLLAYLHGICVSWQIALRTCQCILLALEFIATITPAMLRQRVSLPLVVTRHKPGTSQWYDYPRRMVTHLLRIRTFNV